jgi:hypothetical protein
MGPAAKSWARPTKPLGVVLQLAGLGLIGHGILRAGEHGILAGGLPSWIAAAGLLAWGSKAVSRYQGNVPWYKKQWIWVLGFLAAMAALTLLSLSGCMPAFQWAYRADPPTGAEPAADRTLVVLPLSDAREGSNSVMLVMLYVPLCPYGWVDMPVPDPGGLSFREELAKAMADELQASGVFREAFFSPRTQPGDLVLRGNLRSSRFNTKYFSYGLSGYGTILWLIGLPQRTTSNELWIEMQIEDPASKTVLWKGEYRRKKSELSWMYVQDSGFYYHLLLKGVMREAIPSMRAKLSAAAYPVTVGQIPP